MPVYEYWCRSCRREFEKLGPISARDEQADCPACGANQAQRVISMVAALAGNSAEGGSQGGCCGGGGGGCACRN